MVDLELLTSRGITTESLQKALQGDPLGKAPERSMSLNYLPPEVDPETKAKAAEELEKRQRLMHRIRSRIQEGMTRNLADFRIYYALDKAWDIPFRQISPTLISTFLDTDPNNDDVYKAFNDWGLTHLIQESKDPKTGKATKSLNMPVFFEVLVPLVKSYVTIRWAKIMNDRRLTPFFKYEPVKMTTPLQLKCDVITDRIQIMSEQMGYFDVMKQSVLKMLHYSFCLQFPKEEWYSVEQTISASAEDAMLRKDTSEGDEITVTEKEGLRYHHPHPTRTFYDLAHGPYTFNYDTGCEYAGYWRIARYREIVNGSFWNKDKIAMGTVDLVTGNRLFFTTVYSACTLTMPVFTPPKMPEGSTAAASLGVGPGNLDREKEIATLYYGTEQGDQGVLVTEYFERLIPKDNGLGDYEHPVWFRFVVAGDGCTVLYAAPLPYCPVIYYGYDADESRSKNASMSLEVLPFQDQFSNMLTQIILTAKQNLANMTLLDEDQLTETSKGLLQNMGEKFFRKLNLFWYSSRKAGKYQNKVAEAAIPFNFPKGNTAELVTVLKTILDVLERVLVMSSQEVAQAASHEQTREEIRNISQSTSSRLVFTAIPIDIAESAWKRQLYEGLMAYGDPDFFAHIPNEIPLTEDALKAMGFTFTDKKDVYAVGHVPRFRRAKISKKSTAIPLWELASTRDNEDRTNNEKLAQTLAQIATQLMQNPVTAQAIGADQAIDLANKIIQFAGLPRDLKLRNASPAVPPEQAQQQAQAQLQQVSQMVLQQVGKEIEPLMDSVKQNQQDVQLVMTRVAQIMQALNLQAPNPANDPNREQAPPGPGQ